jgi:DHA1 family bicyclomycin/chloramphenicol resistance-like MFS transporter
MNYSIRKTVWTLAPMVMALALAMDVYVPAVPRLAKLFDVSAGEMQLTLNLFMFTSGIVQLIIGPLSDQFGRRAISFFSILIFAVGSVCCAISHNAPQLITFRVIQAIGSVGMLVTGFAIVRDRYHGDASAKTYSYLNGIIAFSPMFAPFIGSYLDVDWGWQTTFLSLLLIALWALLSIYFAVPEPLAEDKRIPVTMRLFSEYKDILFNRTFSLYTLSTAVGLSYLFIFCSISPYIIIRLLHIPELHYGYYFAFMGVSFFVGSLLSSYFIGKFGVYRTVVLGFIISLVGGLIMTVWYYTTGLTINNFIWPMLLIGVGGTFGLGAGGGGSMEPFGDKAGAAAALGGSIRFLFSSLVGVITITKNVSSTLPLSLSAVAFSVICLLLFFIYRKSLLIAHNGSKYS